MLKGMFINCWGCHLTIRLDDKVLDWYKLEIIDKGETICNADFCSKFHLASWLKSDLIPLLVQELFDEASEEKQGKASFGGTFVRASGALFSNIGKKSSIGKCTTCSKNGPLRMELLIYHNKTTAYSGFCSLDCLKPEKIVGI